MALPNFPSFAKLAADSFQFIAAHDNVFEADIGGEVLYQTYLEAFPEGTNPTFKERTEHDCSCCKQFIRRAGSAVSLSEDGTLITVWDDAAAKAPYPYDQVATIMRAAILESGIANLYRAGRSEGAFGAKFTRSMGEDGTTIKWDHFYTGEIPSKLRSDTPDKIRGDYRTTVQVFERGLTELKSDAIDTVLSLIDANSLYRGAEHLPAIKAFQKAQKAFQKASDKNLFVWTHATGQASRFRNTVIGTLVTDLSDGKDVVAAVGAFEAKVAPENYKRTSAIITPMMVNKAMETIKELDLEPALDRRFAKIEDITMKDVLWADGGVKPLMKGGIGDVLMAAAAPTTDSSKDEERAKDIPLEEFMTDVVPDAEGMEVLFKGEHLGNLMSLTAPVDPDPRQLFQWTNDFAWSYGGNITDSIKERVKRAGGNVTNAALRVSLSWFNSDDLDIRVREPGKGHRGGSLISYQSMRGSQGGLLDVDMNVGTSGPKFSRNAVENVAWRNFPDGAYEVMVHNYSHRESTDVGFVIEVECRGKLHHFNYGREVRNNAVIDVVMIHVKNGAIDRFEALDKNITTSAISQEKWGLKTESYARVNAVTLSPNYWGDNSVGNKHTFFVLEGAENDEPCRGIYNEFLHPRLTQHRKVFEVIGDKTKCQPTEGQLSGLGFSSTKKDSVIVKVMAGKKQRLYNVHIGA